MDKLIITVTLTALLIVSNLKETVSQNNEELDLVFSIVFTVNETSSTAAPSSTQTTTTADPGITDDPDAATGEPLVEENEIFVARDTYSNSGPCETPLEDFEETCNDALMFLREVYENTTGSEGYKSLEYTNPSSENNPNPLKQYYIVTYNYTILNADDGDLMPLINGLLEAQSSIEENGQAYDIDPTETAFQSENQPNNVKQQVVDQASAIGCGEECLKGTMCYLNEGPDSIIAPRCTNSCQIFNDETSCETHSGLFSVGTCRLDERYTPYCYCDDWGLWGEYADYSALYHDNKCISIDFLLAVCIGGVCLILTLLSVAICCLCNTNEKLEEELEDIRDMDDLPFNKIDNSGMANPMYENNWQNPANAGPNKGNLYADTEDIHLQTRDSLHRGYPGSSLNGAARSPSKKRESGLYMYADDGGYNNSAYQPEPGAPWDSKASDVTESDAYRNFKPSLGHIDPKANYNIKRPNLAVRPTDGLHNVEDDQEMPSFRL